MLWGFPVPIILALLLNRIRKTGIKKKVQLLIYMPNFISVIVLCGMVRMLLSPVGPLNKVLGISTNWMTMPSAFRTIYIASGIWQAAGWSSIMYTAALANASKELEEAAIMNSKYVYPNVFMSIDDTNKVSQYDTDIKKYAEQKKADWILNGGIEKEWDSYLKKMEQYGLSDYLSIKQKYFDQYQESLSEEK